MTQTGGVEHEVEDPAIMLTYYKENTISKKQTVTDKYYSLRAILTVNLFSLKVCIRFAHCVNIIGITKTTIIQHTGVCIYDCCCSYNINGDRCHIAT